MRVSTSQFQQTSVEAMLDRQAALSKTQLQIASGRRILRPSDDPAGAARGLELAQSIGTIESYQKNIDLADSRMRLEESVLTSVGDNLQRIRELTVQGLNASQTAEDRHKIGVEVSERLDQLLQLANSTDGNGEYLFAGLRSRTQPFTREGGLVSYHGDQGARSAQVGPNRQMGTNHSGFEVFMDLPNGNGRHVVQTPPGNTGQAVAGGVVITDAAAAASGVMPYRVGFEANSAGDTVVFVTDGNGDLVNPDPASLVTPPASPLPLPPPVAVADAAPLYQAGDTVSFDGLSISFQGDPQPGDSFTVAASTSQALFDTVRSIADALNQAAEDPVSKARFANTANRGLQELDTAMNSLLEFRAEIGARMNGLDSERNANEAALLELQATKSRIEDLDLASAVSELNLRLTGLQAAQQSYTRIQGLSLFSFL